MTRLINRSGRAAILLADGSVDVQQASAGRFGPSIQTLYSQWSEFLSWAQSTPLQADAPAPNDAELGSPVPTPRQLIGVGINTTSSLEANRLKPPSGPGVFAKFPTAVSGPYDRIPITSERVFTEVELGVVIGARAESVSEADALQHVAGVLTIQDLFDPSAVVALESLEGQKGTAYTNLGKSRAAFAPLGPELVTLDEIEDIHALTIDLWVNGVQWQHGSTAELIFDVPALISRISAQIPLLEGDVILTGSPYWLPAGAGKALAPGDQVVATVQGLGTQRTPAVASAQPGDVALTAGAR